MDGGRRCRQHDSQHRTRVARCHRSVGSAKMTRGVQWRHTDCRWRRAARPAVRHLEQLSVATEPTSRSSSIACWSCGAPPRDCATMRSQDLRVRLEQMRKCATGPIASSPSHIAGSNCAAGASLEGSTALAGRLPLAGEQLGQERRGDDCAAVAAMAYQGKSRQDVLPRGRRLHLIRVRAQQRRGSHKAACTAGSLSDSPSSTVVVMGRTCSAARLGAERVRRG